MSKNAEGDSEWICLAALVLSSAAAAWPLAAGAQQLPLPVVGFIDGGSADGSARFVTAFRKGLNETGFDVYAGKILKGEKPADLPLR